MFFIGTRKLNSVHAHLRINSVIATHDSYDVRSSFVVITKVVIVVLLGDAARNQNVFVDPAISVNVI